MLSRKIKNQIKNTARKHLKGDYKLFVFGSRASGKSGKFSDIDLGILGKDKLPGHIIVKIKEELENSHLPYKVDVVDFSKVSKDFKKVAIKQIIPL